MDPISVVTGVFGLVSAATKLIITLNDLAQGIKEAAGEATAAAAELNSITLVVEGLKVYVSGKVRASAERLHLITVEHITTTLTACIETYGELDEILKSLHTGTGLRAWDRVVWLMKKDRVVALTARLQGHKATFTMMLNILQSQSMGEAESTMDKLCDAVNEVLRTNQDLARRLRNLESRRPKTLRTSRVDQDDVQEDQDSREESLTTSVSSSGTFPLAVSKTKTEDIHSKVSQFEEILNQSRVYRHASASHSESSLVDDARSTLALSICSSLTLGDVSNISIYALPVYSSDLSNGDCYKSIDIDFVDTPSASASPSPQQATQSKRRVLRLWSTKGSKQPVTKPEVLTTTPIAPAIFGRPLDESIRIANVAISLEDENGQAFVYGYIPIVVAKCGVFIKEKGVEVPHIFMQSAIPTRLQTLQDAFDSAPRYGKGLNWAGYTVHDAANLLLRFVLTLPHPVIPLTMYNDFHSPLLKLPHLLRAEHNWDEFSSKSSTTEWQETLVAYKELITAMPPFHRQLLVYLLDFLGVIGYREEVNKVSIEMLAKIFQPGILHHPEHNSMTTREQSQKILAWLIAANYNDDFSNMTFPPIQSTSSE